MRMISTLKNLLHTIFSTTNVDLFPVANFKNSSLPKKNYLQKGDFELKQVTSRSFIVAAMLVLISSLGYSQSAGFNNTFIVLSLNGGANAFYDLNAATANPDFNTASLGTFAAGSSNLILKGAQHNVYKCGSSDLTSTRLNYRIYPTASPSGSYTAQSIGYTSTAANGCGGQDQQWSNTGLTTNLLTGLGAGAYTIEVYSDATVTNCCGGVVYAANSGNNYKATFTVSSIIWANTGALTAWYTAANWNPSTVSGAWLAGSVAEFQNAGTATTAGINMGTASLSIGQIDVTAARTRILTIGNSSATVGTLTLNGAIAGSNANVILRNSSGSLFTLQNNETGTGKTMNIALGNATTNTIDAAGIGGITISSAISGVSRSITKIGSGTLTLSGTNTYSGGTIISGGTVSAGAAANLGDAGGAITLGSGATSATLSATGSFTRNVLNVTTSSTAGVIDVAASQTLTLGALNTASGTDNTTKFGKSGAGTLTLSGAGSYVGQTQIGQGTVIVSNNAGLGTNNSTVARGIDLGLNVGDVSQANNVSVLATTGITVPQSIYVAPNTTAATRTIGTSGATASATFSNEVYLDGSATLAPVSGGTLTMSGNIINTGGLTTTTGTTLLSGTNTYSGTTTVSSGTLRIGSTSALGSTAAGTSITSGAVLDLNGINYASAEALTVNGTGISSGGAIINSSATGATYAGLLTLGSASRIVGGTGTIAISNTGTITGSGFGLTLGGAQGGSIASIIGTGTGTLTKLDAGTWTLLGANTYTGATTISGGTLRLGAAGVVADGSAISLGGGTLSSGVSAGFSETMGTLALTANSIIALGTGNHTLTFANSSAVSWTAATTLTITGWTGTAGSSGTAGRIFVGTLSTHLTAGQLGQITFTGYPGTPILLSTGELVPAAPLVPSIAISGVDPGASSVTVGTSSVILQQYNLAVTTAGTNLTGLNVTTAGTYATADITNLKVRYSTDGVLDGADATLSTLTAPGTAGSLTFPSFSSQAISNGTTGYIFITADVAVGATGGNTVNIASNAFTNFTFSSGTKTGTDPVAAAGVKTFSSLVPSIAISNSAPASSNQNAGTNDVILQRLDFAVTVTGTTFNGLTVTTAGTYASADITNLKVRYSTDNVLDGGDATLSTFTTPGVAGSKVFPSFTSQALSSGSTYYIFITADIASTATGGNTISLGSTAFSNISFSAGTKTGTDPVAASNTVTIVNPSIAISNSSPAASSHIPSSTDIVLNRFDFAVTSSNATLTGITVTTAGTYISADVLNLKVRYSTDATLDGGDATLSTFTTPGVAGSKTFPSFTSQVITAGTTGYIFITADISSTATPNNTISLGTTAFSNLTFTLGNKTGTNPVAAGNTRTFIKAEPTNYPTAFTCGTTTTTTIPLTWADASAGVTPDGYLIRWSATSFAAIADPIDGTTIANGSSAQNVAQGVQSHTATGLTGATTYFFKIWSYTNSGTNINYKLVSEPQTSCATTTAPVTIWTNPITGTNPGSANPYTTGETFDPLITVSGIGMGSGIANSSANERYNANSWNTGALDVNDYFSFTLTPNTGYQINFNNLVYTGQASGTGPTNIAIRSSVDAYTANIGTPSISGTTISLTAGTYQNITSAITYRVYAWGGTLSTGTFSINDFTFTGNVVSLGTITTGTIGGGTTTYCAGATSVSVPFTYTPSGNFPNGTCTFTAQLSDATGLFTSPVTLQSATSDASGSQSISATIPLGTLTGTGYRIRVISTLPTVNGGPNGAALTINNSSTSITPAGAQTLVTSTNGTTLTVNEGHIATSRQWKYGTAPGGPYGTNLGTATTQVPNFAAAGTYYMVCESTYPAPCSNTVISNNEVVFTVNNPAPEINITGNSVNIVNGDNTPSLTDHTNFGSTAWGATITRTFTIQNTGSATINISGASPYVLISGSNPSNFSISTPPSNSISAGSSTTFIVTFTPNAVASFDAILTIPNNDSDEPNYAFYIQGVGTASNLSDVSFNSASAVSTNSNIDYISYQGTALSNTGTGLTGSAGVMGFYLRDGGSTITDADNLGTELTGITFSVTNPGSIRSARLFNGASPLGAAVTVSGTSPIVFSGLTGVSVADNAQLALSLRVTFNAPVTDNQQMQFTVTSVSSAVSGSSAFAASNGGGAISSTTGDINRIEVTADRLAFLVQPVTTTVSTNMASVTVRGTDLGSSLDLDYTGSIDITSTGSLTGTPVNAVASAGVATYSSLNHSALGTGLTLTATTTGLASSNTIASTTFDIVSTPLNSYRTTATGVWNSNTALPAIWERLTSGWTASNSPAYATSNNVYIRNGHTLTTNGSFGSSVNLIIESGGTLIVDHTSTAASILVKSGGILEVNASLTVASGGTFTVEDNADVYLNFAFSNPTTSIWQGTENFGALSNLYIWDWNDAQPLINGNVTTNTYSGYTAAFGNVYIDISGALGIAAAWNLLGSSTGTTNLTHGNFEFDSPNGFDIRFLGSVGATAIVGIQGNLVLNSGWSSARSVVLATSTANLTVNLKGNLVHNSPGSFLVRASNSGGNSTLNIDGNIVMNGAGTTATTKFILNQNSYGTVTGGLAIVNLKGNITVGANPLIGNSGNIIEQQFNFTGTTTQLVNIASVVGGTGTRGVPMAIKANAIVQLNTNNLTINNSSTLLVEANGTLDFGFNGTTALLVNQPGTPTGTNTFESAQGSILKITSPDGIVGAVTANLGNVQLSVSNKTFNNTATFWYIGKANQVTGNALTTGSTGKVVICDLDSDTYTLTVSNNTGISSGTLVDALGGKLDIRKGIVVGTNAGDFSGSGRLVMSGGTYRIESNTATVPFLSNYANYSLTGGTVELNATGNQTLSGAPSAYYNIAATGSNTLGTDFKGVSSALVVNNNVLVSGTSVFDLQSNAMTGAAGLTMTGGRIRMSKLSVVLPEITGVATPYALSGGIVELYGSSTGQTHSLRGTFNAGASNVSYFNVELNAALANVAATQANIVAQAGFSVQNIFNVNSPACFQLASSFTIADAGVTSTFNVNAGATLKYGGTIDASGATGNIQTDTRTFSTTASYGFVGTTTPQSVGSGLPATMVNLYMDKGAATNIVTLAGNTTMSNQLVLGTGILDAVSNTVSVSNTATTGVSGASANSFVSGKLNRSLPASLLTGTTYDFPIGKQSPITYLPGSLVNPTTGIGAVSVTMEAFNANSGGTADPNSIGSLSTSEYWSLAATGNFNGSQFTLSRPTAVTPLSSIGRSTTTATGTYVFIGGTPSGSQIANSNFSAGNTQFLAFANPIAAPTITLVQATSPTFATQADYTGFVGQTLTITGTNFTSTGSMSVSIGGIAATTFTVINSTTITAVVAQAASGANVVVTNTITSGNASAAFTFLGWISNASTDWGTGSTWLGGVVPPASVVVTIAHAVTANAAVTDNPNTLTILAASSLTFGVSGTLTINTTLTNGGSIVMTAGGTLTLANSGTLTNNGTFTGGTGTTVFAGAGTLNGATASQLGNFTINGGATLSTIPTINGTLQINAGGFVSASPRYATNSILKYNTSSTYGRGAEWNATGTIGTTAGYPFSVQVSNNTTLQPGGNGNQGTVLNMGGNLTIDAGSSMYLDFGGMIMTVDFNVLGSVTLNGNLSLTTTSGKDIYVGGSWIANTGSAFNANGKAVFLNGTANQNIGGSLSTTFPFLILNNSAGATLTAAQTVSTTLTLTSGKLTLGNFNLSLSGTISGASASNYIVSDGSGYLIKNNLSGSFVYPVGPSSSVYSPATLNQSGTADNIGVKVAGAPTFVPSVNDLNQMVNLQWTINEAVAGGNNLSTTFQWPAASESVVAPGFIRTNGVFQGFYNGTNWTIRASTIAGTDPYTSASATNFTGNLANSQFVIGNINGILGCIQTAAATDWNTASTWVGGLVPPQDATVCINHNITVASTPSENPSGITFNTGGDVSISNGASLNIQPNGFIINNSGSTRNLTTGTIAFSGAGSVSGANSINFNKLQLNGTTVLTTIPTINTELEILPGSSITSINSPIYGASSILKYNVGASYNRSNEWKTTTGDGYPANVLVTGNTTLNLDAGAALSRSMQGNMQIDAGSTLTQGASTFGLIIPGNITIDGTYTQSTSVGGDLLLGGNWSRGASGTYTTNSRSVTFNGAANQSIARTGGAETFAYLISAKSAGNLVLNGTDITINGNTGNVLEIASGNTIDLNTRTLSISGSSGNINLPAGAATIAGAAGSLVSISGGTKTVTPAGGATLNFGSNVLVALSSGLNFGANTSTINGTLQIAFGGFVSTNAPFYATNSTLRYFSGSDYTRGTEWSATSGAGYPFNVTIDPNGTNTTLNMGSSATNQTIAGNLTINSGAIAPGAGLNMEAMTGYLGVAGNVVVNNAGVLTLSSAIGGDIKVAGNFTRNTGGTLTQNNRELEMNGTTLQTINGVNAFDYLAINNTGSTVRITANTAVRNRLRLTNGTLDLISPPSFTLTMSDGSEIYRTASTATMNTEPTLTAGDDYDVRYAGTLTTGNEFSSNNTFVRDLIIESGALPTLGGNRTVNRNLILSGGNLNLATFTFTHRGRATAPAFSGSITVSGGGTRLITGSTGCRYDVTGLGANQPNDYTKTVSTFGGTLLSFDSNVLVGIGDGAIDFGFSGGIYPTTINGTLQVMLGGSVGQILNPCYYGTNSTLRFSNTVDYQVGLDDKTWASGLINSGNPGIPWNVEVNDAGTDLQLQSTRALRNNLTITDGSFTLTNTYTGSFNLGGNWTRTNVSANSAFTHNNIKVVFDRQTAGNQIITAGGTLLNPLTTETFYDLEVSTSSGDIQLGTSSNVNITNNLNFVNGRFDINGANNLIIGNSSANGTITGFGAGRYVISSGGNLRRYTNTNTSYDFPVGDNTTYSPAQLNITFGGQANAFIDTKVVNAMHPNMTTPAPTRYIARYWSVEPTGLLDSTLYNINYTYDAADEVGTGVMYPVKYSTATTVPGWQSCPESPALATTGTSGANDNVLKTFSWSGLTTFSDFSGAGNGSPLPVELLSFDAVPVNNAEVLVTWTTASEINNEKFIVERSLDAVNFQIVGTVDGAINSNVMRNYSLTDVKPYNGVSYYRLRQVDFNGDQETFTPKEVYLTGAVGNNINVFPNPANETATLSINAQYEGKAVLSIFDIAGRNIINQQINITEGSNLIKLEVDGLADGKYLLNVTLSDGTRMNLPLIISK